jgi:hypothetical protein
MSCNFWFENEPNAPLPPTTIVPCAQSIGNGNSPVPVSADVSDLSPGTLYGVTLRVTTADSQVWEGSTQTFTTPGSPPPPSPPTVVTNAATNIQSTSAVLNGTVNPNGSNVTDCHFIYGIATAGPPAYSVPCLGPAGGGTTPVTVEANPSGLIPGTQYTFQLIATNGGGTAKGGSQSFTTPTGGVAANPPVVVTNDPSNLQPTSATLNGAVNPNGSPVTDCHFAFYSHPSEFVFLYSVPCAQSVGGGSTTVNVSANVNGLIPGMSYAYQLFASNAGGTRTDIAGAFSTPLLSLPPPVPQHTKSILKIITGGLSTASTGLWCSLAATAGKTAAGGLDAPAMIATCSTAVAAGVGFETDIADPPDQHYEAVFVPKPFPVLRMSKRCQGLVGTQCREMRAAEKGYLRAAARVSSLAEATGVTANRFTGAIDAGNVFDAQAQATAENGYIPDLMAAIGRAKSAGSQLAHQLVRAHRNPRISARQVAHARKRLSDLRGIPGWLIGRFESDGLVSSRSDMKRIIQRSVAEAPPPKPTTLAATFEVW